MAIFGAFLQQSWSEVSCAVLFAWDAIEATGRAVFGPPLTALLQALLLLFECCLPILKVVPKPFRCMPAQLMITMYCMNRFSSIAELIGILFLQEFQHICNWNS